MELEVTGTSPVGLVPGFRSWDCFRTGPSRSRDRVLLKPLQTPVFLLILAHAGPLCRKLGREAEGRRIWEGHRGLAKIFQIKGGSSELYTLSPSLS